MRTNTLITILMLIIAMLGSCKSGEDEATTDPWDGQIKLAGNLIGEDGINSENLEEGVDVALFITTESNQIVYNNTPIRCDGNGKFFYLQPIYWPIDGSNIHLYLYAPYQEEWTGKMEQPSIFTISTDQTSEGAYRASNLLHGTPARGNPVLPTADYTHLSFKHKLANMVINLTDMKGGIDLSKSTVRLLNQPTSLLFTPTTGDIELISSASRSDNSNIYTQTIKACITTAQEKKLSCKAVVAPHIVPAGTPFIEITTPEELILYRASQDQELGGNKEHVFEIEIQNDGMKVTSTVKEWGMGEVTDMEVTTPPTLEDDDPQQGLDLYLCIGQSNMAGRATIPANLKGDMEGVFLLNDKGAFETASNPLNKYSSIRKEMTFQRLSMAYNFSLQMYEATQRPVGLIVNARGDTSIKSWLKGSNDGYYEKTLARLQMALEHGVLKGIIWHQGEKDYTAPEAYRGYIKQLITDLRSDLGIETLPVVVGQIAQWNWTDSSEGTTPFNNMIMTIDTFISYTQCVSSEGLEPNSDEADPHFNAEGQLLFGKRYAEAMLTLQGKK